MIINVRTIPQNDNSSLFSLELVVGRNDFDFTIGKVDENDIRSILSDSQYQDFESGKKRQFKIHGSGFEHIKTMFARLKYVS